MSRKKTKSPPTQVTGEIKKLEVVLKCDVAGTEEAISASLAAIQVPGVEIAIIQSGIGNISKSDILMAQTGSRLIIGLRKNREYIKTNKETAMVNQKNKTK